MNPIVRFFNWLDYGLNHGDLFAYLIFLAPIVVSCFATSSIQSLICLVFQFSFAIFLIHRGVLNDREIRNRIKRQSIIDEVKEMGGGLI